MLQPAGTFGNTGRGDFIGPNLRTVDLSFVKDVRVVASRLLAAASRSASRCSTSSTAPTSAPPQLIAFAGAADNEQPLASFGRVRNTITSARQVQLGVRVRF